MTDDEFTEVMVALADIDYNDPHWLVSRSALKVLEKMAWGYLATLGWTEDAAWKQFYSKADTT